MRPTAFAAWAFGALCAGVVHYEAPGYSDAVVGLLMGALAYTVLEAAVIRRSPVLDGA